MICILKHNPVGDLSGWIIATDIADARRRADLAGERNLAECLYRMDGQAPRPGKYPLWIINVADCGTYVMLVD
jgi:hypothetical protein